MIQRLVLAAFSLLALSAQAEKRLFAGGDIKHRPGSTYFSVEQYSAHLATLNHTGPGSLVVVGYEPVSIWKFRVGLAYLSDTTEISGTRLNFTLSYKQGHFCFRHYSHGTAVGIRRDRANAGWNLAGLCMAYR